MAGSASPDPSSPFRRALESLATVSPASRPGIVERSSPIKSWEHADEDRRALQVIGSHVRGDDTDVLAAVPIALSALRGGNYSSYIGWSARTMAIVITEMEHSPRYRAAVDALSRSIVADLADRHDRLIDFVVALGPEPGLLEHLAQMSPERALMLLHAGWDPAVTHRRDEWLAVFETPLYERIGRLVLQHRRDALRMVPAGDRLLACLDAGEVPDTLEQATVQTCMRYSAAWFATALFSTTESERLIASLPARWEIADEVADDAHAIEDRRWLALVSVAEDAGRAGFGPAVTFVAEWVPRSWSVSQDQKQHPR